MPTQAGQQKTKASKRREQLTKNKNYKLASTTPLGKFHASQIGSQGRPYTSMGSPIYFNIQIKEYN